MQRVFHAKRQWFTWLFVGCLAFLAVWAGWMRNGLLVLISFVLLAVEVDRLINTSYTLTEEELVIRTSRLGRPVRIALADILRVEQSLGQGPLGAKTTRTYLAIIHKTDGRTRTTLVNPKNPDEFVDFLRKRRFELGMTSQGVKE